jgi:altronate hydrolase
VGDKLLGLIRWWESYTAKFGATIDNNPSYGNKEGGLTTIYEKSLGAVAKAGQAPLEAVYNTEKNNQLWSLLYGYSGE